MLQHRKEKHHSQEYDKPENDEIFHGVAIGSAFVFTCLAGLGEDEGLVGVAECLGEHHHHDGYLHVGPIDAHHRTCLRLVARKEIGDKELPHVLAQNAGDSEDQQWPAIAEHPAQQRRGEGVASSGQLGEEAKEHDGGGYDVGKEDPSDAESRPAKQGVKPADRSRTMPLQDGAEKEEEEVEAYVEPDVEEFDSGEGPGFFL